MAKYRKIHEEVMKKLDKLENEFLPQVMVDTTDIIFDVLKFLEPSSKELIIANTGQVENISEIIYIMLYIHKHVHARTIIIFYLLQIRYQYNSNS